jgi:hypothetical protein
MRDVTAIRLQPCILACYPLRKWNRCKVVSALYQDREGNKLGLLKKLGSSREKARAKGLEWFMWLIM